MLALDLFNNEHERRLAEGAVDQLEQRRIDDLAMKMDDLVARAKDPAYKKNPAALSALMKEFQKCKDERDGYYKLREAGIGQDIANKTEKMARATPPTKTGAVASTVKNAAKWLADKGGPGKEGPTYEGAEEQWSKEGSWTKIPKNKAGQPVDPRGEVAHLSDVARREAERKAAQDQKKNPKEVAEHGGGIGPKQRWQDLMQERKLSVGDAVIVTAPNEFEGKTGEIAEFSPSGKFVVVNLYNHGEHSMHLSDVEYNQYADDENNDDWYDESVAEGWSDAMVAQRTGQPRTPYSVYINGKKWKDFENDDHAEAVANKLRAKFKADGRDPGVITIAPTDVSEGVVEAEDRVDPILIKALNNMPDGLASHHEVLDACYDAYAMELGKMRMKSEYGTTRVYIPKLMDLYKQKHGLTFNEAANPAQQAAIAIAMKRAGKKPKKVDEETVQIPHKGKMVSGRVVRKDPVSGDYIVDVGEYGSVRVPAHKVKQGVAEGNPNSDPWYVYAKQNPKNFKKFKTYDAAKAYAEKHGLTCASAGHFHDKVKEGIVASGPSRPLDDRAVRKMVWDTMKINADTGEQALQRALTVLAKKPQSRMVQDLQDKFQNLSDRLAQGLVETTDVKSGMAKIYNKLAPKIERHRDSFLAGQLYDELENYAELHGAETEFKRMMNGARNRAHMEYDTNPGGFQNWFWFLPFGDDITEDQDTSGVESAIIRRIMVAHVDWLQKFGPEKVMQAAEEVAYNVGDVDEIGTSDVSAYVHEVGQILGVDQLNEKWSQKYKSSINCANPKGFSQRAHCAGKKK